MKKILYNMENLQSMEMGGPIGDRLKVNLRRWMCDVPYANPAMFQKLRNRSFLWLEDYSGGHHEYLGKYLTGACYCWRLSRDPELMRTILYTVDQIAEAQDPSGYLGPEAPGNWFVRERAGEGEEKYTWDLWSHYHIMLGLLLVWRTLDCRKALDTCLKAASLIRDYFADRDFSEVRCGFTNLAVSHIFALLHLETGEESWLRLSERAVAALADPVSGSGSYLEEILAGKDFYELANTRWEGLHAVEAFAVLYRITGTEKYLEALRKIVRSILKTDRHNTGGFSSDERAVGSPYDLRAIETCCTVEWLVILTHLFQLTGDASLADEIELSTYNGIFSAQHPSGRHSTYNTPMIGYKKASLHEIVFQAIAGSPETNCCSINIGRALAGMAEWGFIPQEDALRINYYGACSARVAFPDGTPLSFRQETDYPKNGHVRLVLESGSDKALLLRIPCWSKKTGVSVNGEPLPAGSPGTYLRLNGPWKAGDVVDLDLDFSIHCWLGEKAVAGKASYYRGPLLLAYDYRFNGANPRPFSAISVEGTPAPIYSGKVRFGFSDAPKTAPQAVSSAVPVDLPGFPAPWVALKVRDEDGNETILCDFITAGQTGAPYTTWLPLPSDDATAFLPTPVIWNTRF